MHQHCQHTGCRCQLVLTCTCRQRHRLVYSKPGRQLYATQNVLSRPRCSSACVIGQGRYSVLHTIRAGYLSAEAKSLVKALLEKDAGRRLGSGATGAAAVKAHPFFRRINWQALTAREVWASHAGCTRHLHAVKLMPHIASMRSRVHRLCAPA